MCIRVIGLMCVSCGYWFRIVVVGCCLCLVVAYGLCIGCVCLLVLLVVVLLLCVVYGCVCVVIGSLRVYVRLGVAYGLLLVLLVSSCVFGCVVVLLVCVGCSC